MIVYFILFIGVCGALLTAALIRPARFYEFPYFMSATFAVFFLPQVMPLVLSDRRNRAEMMVSDFLLMSALCLIGCWVGYRLPSRSRSRILASFSVPADINRLFHAGIAFVIAGFAFDYLIGALPEESKGSMWTGVATIYLFFATLIYPGFALCMYCAMKKRWPAAWIVTAVAAVIPLRAAIFYARREGAVLLAFTIGLTLFFVRRYAAPRLVAAACLVLALFFIPATGQYRSLARLGPLEALRSIDFMAPLQAYSAERTISEVRNGIAVIAVTRQSDSYRYGIDYWNQIVLRFVPAQILGAGFKNSLLGGERDDISRVLRRNIGYSVATGSTITGIADSFRQFSFFGALVFLLMGWFFKLLWTAASEEGFIIAQVFYIQIVTSAMRAVTHQTVDFLPGAIYSGIFLWLVARYSAARRTA